MEIEPHRCPGFPMDTTRLDGFEPGYFQCCYCGRVTYIYYNTLAYCPDCGVDLHERRKAAEEK